ncbi:MAG: transglycosylase domain-containing protein [Polyangiaceae bacterium]
MQILEQYLNRVDFGPNLRGISAASRGYFGKPLGALSPGEMALLVGLPQSPTNYAPDRALERALGRRRVVIESLTEAGLLSPKEAEIAKREAVALRSRSVDFGAPHFVTALRTGALTRVQPDLSEGVLKSATRVTTTIDSSLQRIAEVALSSALSRLTAQRVTSGAVLVVENETGDVVAYVGSPNFYDEARHGQVDGVRALRQPGSTLKPFVYAAAFEKLGLTPASVLPDLELTLDTPAGPYSPRNFDDKFRGPVRVREALGNSLNVPAVRVAMSLGARPLLDFLHRLGFDSLRESPEMLRPRARPGRWRGHFARTGSSLLHVGSRWLGNLAQGRIRFDAPRAFTVGSAKDDEDLRAWARGTRHFAYRGSRSHGRAQRRSRPAKQLRCTFRVELRVRRGGEDGHLEGLSGQLGRRLYRSIHRGRLGRKLRRFTHAAGERDHRCRTDLPRGDSSGDAFARRRRASVAEWEEAAQLREHFGLKHIEICPISGGLRGEHCPHGVTEYVPYAMDWPECPWHRELVLDGRNGLLAGKDCPSSVLRREVFEVFDRQYDGWARSTGRRIPPRELSPLCSQPSDEASSDGDEALRITYPREGSRFVLDPERPLSLQRLQIEVDAPASSEALQLWVDERTAQRSTRPFSLTWPLTPGVHRLRVTTDKGASTPPVTIEVRAAEP